MRTGWKLAGTKGLWRRPSPVGPALLIRVVLGAPGLPGWLDWARMVVRAARLKYRREFSWGEPLSHLARKEIS